MTPVNNQRVKIIKSPYHAVRNGTICNLIKIKYNHFGRNQHLYIVDLEYSYFRQHEVKILDG